MKEGENQDIITLALNGIMYMGHWHDIGIGIGMILALKSKIMLQI